ncbi:hypothetical protein CEE37_04685 [candidate division LCP-89 bacterium B3_LCP]|uniref:Secretion system C-terminal sorting domain-containing protein n=1 Tax=candidate division LCP-89 bacterium B3_LCP TaxID=2012998 RepID=A0A532V3Y5_UNCL8|nr:MAG: hypothetical protein CEE37_04685 [candidate division LCP-89 bacterium B3_LCP]
MRFKIFLSLIPALVLTLTGTTHAWWFEYDTIEENMPVAADSGVYQGYPVALPFINGSTIILYHEGQPLCGNYYQIIDKYGQPVLTEPQNLMPQTTTGQYALVIPDEYGGVFATAAKLGSDEGIWAQQIDSLGNRMWGDAGIRVCDEQSGGVSMGISTDGTGGFLITHSASVDIHVFRIDGSGQHIWSEDGVIVCDNPDQQSNPRITHDGSGGAYVSWRDYRSPFGNYGSLWMQHLDSEGNELWQNNGILIHNTGPWFHQLIPDEAGGVIAQTGSGIGNTVRRIDPAGHILWSYYGASYRPEAKIIRGEPGFFYLGWSSYDEYTIYAQKMDMQGNFYWNGQTGAVMGTFRDYHTYSRHNFAYRHPHFYGVFEFYDSWLPDYLFAQRLDSLGNRMWGESGVMVAYEDDEYINYPNIVPDPDEDGGAVIVYESYWGHDIFGKHVNANGSLGGPDPRKRPAELHPVITGVSDNLISYSIIEAGFVRIELYNLLGRYIKTIENTYLPTGKHTTQIDPSELVSGIYFLKLETHTGSMLPRWWW